MVDIKKFLPKKDAKKKKDYYWSLVIEPGWVQAGLWEIEDGIAKIMFSGSPTPWSLKEELVNATDTALSSVVQNISEDIEEPSKTVISVTSSWVYEGQIRDEHLEKIKKICTSLSLEPVGFVVLSEAIAFYRKSEEGAPLNAICLGVYKESVEISLFVKGRLKGDTEVARSVLVIDDVIEGLTRLKQKEAMPSRIIIYDGKEGELEEVRQALLKVNWDDFGDLQFLHTPKIEIVKAVEKITAVCLAGASELAQVKSIKKKDRDEVAEEKAMSQEDTGEDISASDAGFKVSEEVFGKGMTIHDSELDESVDNVRPVSNYPPRKKLSFSFLSKLKNLFTPFLNKLKSVKALSMLGGRAFLIGLTAMILILATGFAFWWYYPKATVTVYLAPKTLEEEVSITVDAEIGNSNVEEKVLKAEIIKMDVDGEKTGKTTGQKTVGEKAKGEVTVYRTGGDLTLSSGTILYGPGDLKFNFDEDVSVASGSASSPSSTKAKVTAEDIGSEYNFASETSFRISNYPISELEAKNKSSFSGGTSYEIQVVSEEDQERLSEELEEELIGKAKDDLLAGLSTEKHFIEESLNAELTSSDFNGKVGDEGTSLKLDLSLEVAALVVNKSELMDFSQKVLSEKVPDGYVLRDEQIDVEFKFEEEENGSYKFEVKLKANLLPQVDTEKLVKELKGKYPKLAEDYLVREIPGFVRAEIRLRPKLPARINTLPRVEKNIEVEVAAER